MLAEKGDQGYKFCNIYYLHLYSVHTCFPARKLRFEPWLVLLLTCAMVWAKLF